MECIKTLSNNVNKIKCACQPSYTCRSVIRKHLPDKPRMLSRKRSRSENCFDSEKELQQQMSGVAQNQSTRVWLERRTPTE